jgi:hypothetical protein
MKIAGEDEWEVDFLGKIVCFEITAVGPCKSGLFHCIEQVLNSVPRISGRSLGFSS